MYVKIQITGVIEVKTGLHIGGSSAFAAIGAVDSPVIRDVRTDSPIIPGSSFKGKLRSLLAKEYNTTLAKKPDDDAECLTRLFGSAKEKQAKRSRVLVSDMFLINEEALRGQGVQSMTEIKFENSINRATAVANPRQIERVIRGTRFGLDILYDLSYDEGQEKEIVEDMEVLAEGFRLMEYDYIGGSGSRGYGKIRFEDVKAETVAGAVREDTIAACNRVLKNAVGGGRA